MSSGIDFSNVSMDSVDPHQDNDDRLVRVDEALKDIDEDILNEYDGDFHFDMMIRASKKQRISEKQLAYLESIAASHIAKGYGRIS